MNDYKSVRAKAEEAARTLGEPMAMSYLVAPHGGAIVPLHWVFARLSWWKDKKGWVQMKSTEIPSKIVYPPGQEPKVEQKNYMPRGFKNIYG